jgi:hypothetical protein
MGCESVTLETESVHCCLPRPSPREFTWRLQEYAAIGAAEMLRGFQFGAPPGNWVLPRERPQRPIPKRIIISVDFRTLELVTAPS